MVFRRSLFPVAKPPATVANDVREEQVASVVHSDVICPMTLDLLPVPTAVMALTDGAIVFESVNQAFKQAGFGTDGIRSPLTAAVGEQIAAFLRSTDVRQRLALRLGDAIDCRQYDVTLARRAALRTIARCIVTLVDQTPEQRTETSLRREMNTDSLTGLPNRAGFDDRIDERITDANRVSYAVLAINLDRFSRINACMGSLSGDELLISVARRLRGALRARDTLARTGGDEFAVLMTVDDGSEDALQVAGRIQQALVQPFRLSDFQIQVDCSIGIALGQDAADDTENLIRHAQFAVKRSKRTGQTEVYRPDLFDIVRNQFSIETELRMAIEQGELSFAFQPICDLSTARVSSFEALARWRTRDGRAISPTEFIPVAEESGLIVPLGRLAMDQAARTLATWDAASGGHCGVKMAVNLSAVQLQRDDVATMVGDVLSRHGLCGKRFDIELTESAFVVDPDRTLRTMLTLKELGASIAMDDFGTGYSNLAYLQKLPIDKLKIDRSFVTGMMADRDKVAIVGAILSLSQALGMRTVAEGIETPELEQALAAMGCAFGQGFFYSQPIDADAAYRFLIARNH
ncbi:putative bifunctional diguanylate cyclase/phosphodiesterase [Sphingomonas sp. CFBP 13720]|uniref:putative bifunctional diguanylate cyclase/phosphodiesterase n=1 Tax=Sphingomonas sp. CFBP 13720 TaxID=2775302 RepID=UPI00177F0E4B|nr:EAL domain-containing protein [Sphingomonas sp. CFBP 13720]MBD8677140.1 EAL domain-containing protein [Sphingomonas sp. CFBP 13720]